MASPSSRAGYPNRQLTTIPTHLPSFSTSSISLSLLLDALAISPRFRAKPQLSSVFVIKRNHLGAKSRLPISLADGGLAKCRGNQSPVFVPRSLPFTVPETVRRGIPAASRLEWHLVDHQGYTIRQPLCPRQPPFSEVWKNTSKGKKKSGPMNTQTRPPDRFSLSLARELRGNNISSLQKR